MLEFIKTHKTGIIAVTVAAVATIVIILTGAKIYKHKNANPTNTSSVSSNDILNDFHVIPKLNQSKQEAKIKKAQNKLANAETHLKNAQQQYDQNPNAENRANLKNANSDVASSKNTLNQLKNSKKQKPISNSQLPRNMQSHNNRSKNKNKAATALRLNQKPKSKK